MSMPASVTLDVGPRSVVVRACGEFDVASCGVLGSALDEAADLDRPVVLDVTAVAFMDAAALGEIAIARRRLAEAGHPLNVVGARGVVRRIFEVTDLAPLLVG